MAKEDTALIVAAGGCCVALVIIVIVALSKGWFGSAVSAAFGAQGKAVDNAGTGTGQCNKDACNNWINDQLTKGSSFYFGGAGGDPPPESGCANCPARMYANEPGTGKVRVYKDGCTEQSPDSSFSNDLPGYLSMDNTACELGAKNSVFQKYSPTKKRQDTWKSSGCDFNACNKSIGAKVDGSSDFYFGGQGTDTLDGCDKCPGRMMRGDRLWKVGCTEVAKSDVKSAKAWLQIPSDITSMNCDPNAEPAKSMTVQWSAPNYNTDCDPGANGVIINGYQYSNAREGCYTCKFVYDAGGKVAFGREYGNKCYPRNFANEGAVDKWPEDKPIQLQQQQQQQQQQTPQQAAPQSSKTQCADAIANWLLTIDQNSRSPATFDDVPEINKACSPCTANFRNRFIIPLASEKAETSSDWVPGRRGPLVTTQYADVVNGAGEHGYPKTGDLKSPKTREWIAWFLTKDMPETCTKAAAGGQAIRRAKAAGGGRRAVALSNPSSPASRTRKGKRLSSPRMGSPRHRAASVPSVPKKSKRVPPY